MDAIEARSVSKRYDPEGAFALRDVSLSVAPGEIYGLLGPNGSGKSTFVNMLVTLIALTGGSARVAGFDVMNDPDRVRSAIGVTLQDVGVDPVQRCAELLNTQGRLTGLDRAAANRRGTELLELVGLSDKASAKVKQLSGGQRRRLDLALSLVHRPSILFLDEPTTGLDPTSRRDIWKEVNRLRREGTTVLLTTQYLEEADQLADRIGILSAGSLIEEGTPQDLKARHGAQQVVLDVDDHTKAIGILQQHTVTEDQGLLFVRVPQAHEGTAQVITHLAAGGVQVRSARSIAPTLDDVFLKLTTTKATEAAA